MTPFEQQIEQVVDAILQDYHQGRDIDKMELFSKPDRDVVTDIIEKLRRIVFPGYFRDRTYRMYNAKHNLSMLMEDVMFNLTRQVSLAFQGTGVPEATAQERAQEVCLEFFRQLPAIRALIQTDLQASYDGDPAATSMAEIIFSYPGLYAITVYRLAHQLQLLQVPMLPRMMTEYAHSLTGIDIHPGATVGRYFFIDHGTGIVVGETTIIGDHVKLYQGVTLGALSTRGGQNLRGKRRHPTIGNNVTIYAGASVLGGDTVIGDGCVIGSNAFLTATVPPCTTVVIENHQLAMKPRPGCPECPF